LSKIVDKEKRAENLQEKRLRAAKIYEILDPLYTEEKTALEYRTPFELLIATILSAQCTDKQVNVVTNSLFEKYKGPEDYLSVPVEELESDIRPTGFYKNKTRSIRGCCRGLVERYGGQVPATLEELVTLPGVGRKTANCVLGAAFNVPGVVVDTHVKRLSIRMGFTENTHPDKIEQDLMEILPRERWRRFSDILIYHGRGVCKARNPDHAHCAVAPYCPSSGT
jgi:endonuclease III